MANPRPCCLTCGRAFRATVSEPAFTMPSLDVDTSRMSDAQMRAHYARIAPIADVRFFLNLSNLTPNLRHKAESLLDVLMAQGGKATPATKAAYRSLQQDWRASRNAVDSGFRCMALVAHKAA